MKFEMLTVNNCFIPLLYIGTLVEIAIKQTGLTLHLHIDDHYNNRVKGKAKIRNRYNQVPYTQLMHIDSLENMAVMSFTKLMHIDSLENMVVMSFTKLMHIDSLENMVVMSFTKLMHIDSLENMVVMSFTKLMHIDSL